MADIFISYSQLDRERVKPIAERLALLGYCVWWDKPERARQASLDERERAFDAARAVLVVWSINGRDAMEVHADAAHAVDTGKLLQLRIEPLALPPPFDGIPVADMAGGREWGPLEHDISRLVKNGESNPRPARGKLGAAPMIAAAGSPKLVAIAVAAVLAAFAGALDASFNGVMTPSQLQIALVGMLGVAGVCVGLTAHRLLTITRAAA